MSAITRRLFLRRAASAAPAVALATGTGAVLAASADATENADLLALETPLHDAIAGLRSALDQRDQARANFADMAPDVPDELRPVHSSERFLAERRMDHDGNPLLDRSGRAADVFCPANLLHALKGADGRTRRARRLRSTLASAEAFEAADQHAYVASGFEAATFAVSRAVSALVGVTAAIRTAEARSLPGLVLKAQAVTAMRDIGDRDRSYHYVASAGLLLAASILAVANTPAPQPAAAFDYDVAIAKVEGMGVQLAGVIGASGTSEGVSYRKNGVHEDAIQEVLSGRRGFCPIRMGEVLAAQGKVATMGWENRI